VSALRRRATPAARGAAFCAASWIGSTPATATTHLPQPSATTPCSLTEN